MRWARTVVIIGIVAAACSGGGTSGEASGRDAVPSTLAPPSTTATAPLDDEGAIAAAVEAFVETIALASAPPSPDHPAISETATGEAEFELVADIESYVEHGLTVERSRANLFGVVAVRDVVVSAEQAEASVCMIDDLVVRTTAGELVSDEVGTRLMRLEFALGDGTWRVSRVELRSITLEATTCAE